MDEQRAIQLCVKHRDPVGFAFLVEKYRREAFGHAFVLLGNEARLPLVLSVSHVPVGAALKMQLDRIDGCSCVGMENYSA